MIPMHSAVAGRYAFKIGRDLDNPRITAEFDNLITDVGLDKMAESTGWFSVCHVGTGTTPPANNDVALVAPKAKKSMETSPGYYRLVQVDADNFYSRTDTKYRFAPGAAAGNLSEVGVSDSSDRLFSRALIKDADGNPITITVLPDEYLEVTYMLTRHFTKGADIVSTIELNGVTHTVTTRPVALAPGTTAGDDLWSYPMSRQSMKFDGRQNNWYGPYSYTTGLVAHNVNPSTNNTTPGGYTGSYTNKPYVAGSHSMEATCTWPLDQGNAPTGIKSVSSVSGCGMWMHEFDPPIMKTNQMVLNLVFKNSWGRYVP